MGHDVARKKLEGSPQFFRSGPLVRGQHEPAEASGLGLQALDLRNGIVRRADDPLAPVGAGARGDLMRGLAGIGLVGRLQSDCKEIFHIAPDALFDIGPGLFARLSEINTGGHPPVVAGSRYAIFRCRRFNSLPLLGGPAVFAGWRQKQHAVFAGELGTHGISRRSNGQRKARLLIRAELQPHVLKFPEAPLIVDGFRRLEQTNDDVHGLGQHRVELVIGQAEQFFVGNQVARSHAQDDAAAREMIQKSHPLGDVERMMKGKADHRGAEADAMCMGCSFGEHHFRRRHGLPTTRVMLADEKFVEVERIGQVDQRNVAVEGQRGIFRRLVQRHHKKREFHDESLTGYLSRLRLLQRPDLLTRVKTISARIDCPPS